MAAAVTSLGLGSGFWSESGAAIIFLVGMGFALVGLARGLEQ